MSSDKVSIKSAIHPHTAFDIEGIADFFSTKIGTIQCLLHREKRVTLWSNIGECHTGSIVSNTLSDREILNIERIFDGKFSVFDILNSSLLFDNAGEHRKVWSEK